MNKITSFALAQKVLAVCVENEYDWTAYVDAVPGMCHDLEQEEVARTGCKLPKDVAMVLFPGKDEKKWRY